MPGFTWLVITPFDSINRSALIKTADFVISWAQFSKVIQWDIRSRFGSNLGNGFFNAKAGFRTEIRSFNPILHLIWIKPALWVFQNFYLGLKKKKKKYPDPSDGWLVILKRGRRYRSFIKDVWRTFLFIHLCMFDLYGHGDESGRESGLLERGNAM